MEEDKAPFIISVKDGQLTADFHQLFQVLRDATFCSESTSTNGRSSDLFSARAGIDHTSLQPNQFRTVSVVGPPCSGKSFIMNWIAKYLAANGDRGWMGKDPKAVLQGFDWKPFPEDIDEDADDAGLPVGGIRVMRDLPTLQEADEPEGTPKSEVFANANIILLDIDLRNKNHKDFTKYYSALVATCMLTSTLTIYIDTGHTRHTDGCEKQANSVDPKLVVSLLEYYLSSPSAGSTGQFGEIIIMSNCYAKDQSTDSAHTEAKTLSILKSFCNRRQIYFAHHQLPILVSTKPGNFQGALEHMNKRTLQRVIPLMVTVDGLLRKAPQDTPQMFELIKKILSTMNQALKADMWNKLQYQFETGKLSPGNQTPSHEIMCDENIVSQLRKNRATKLAWSKEQESRSVSHPGPEPSSRAHPMKTQEMEMSIAKKGAPCVNQPQNFEAKKSLTTAPSTSVNKASIPEPTEPVHHTCGDQRNHEPEPVLRKDDKVAYGSSGIRKTQKERTTRRVFQTKEEIDSYITKHCMPQLELYLHQAYLKNFMVSSMTRLEIAQIIGEILVSKHFHSNGIDVKKYALEVFRAHITNWVRSLAPITEHIDKGRNIIDNEFDSEVYLISTAELNKLMEKAKKFSSGRFQPVTDKEKKFFESCWAAIGQNTNDRNEKIRHIEQQINQSAIHKVLDFYLVELQGLVSGITGEPNDEELLRIPKLNDELVQACFRIFLGIKDYRRETQAVKDALWNKMAVSYHEKIGNIIEAVQRRIQKELDEKRKQEDGERKRQEELEKLRKEEEEEARRQKELEEKRRQEEESQKSRSLAPSLVGAITSSIGQLLFGRSDKSDSYASKVKAGSSMSISPIQREKIYPSGPTQPPETRLSTHDCKARPDNGSILVMHIGRHSTIKFIPVGKFPEKHPYEEIPGWVARVNGEIVIGESAMGVEGGIALQDIRARGQIYVLSGDDLRAEQVFGLFIAKAKKMAESRIGELIESCLLVIPAFCTPVDRQALIDSTTVAGFVKVKLISEPSAVAFDYYINHYKCQMTTRSADMAMVLYLGANGDKELVLYNFSPHTQPGVQMKAMSGSLLLTHIPVPSSLWNIFKTYSEFQKYAHDVTSANASNSSGTIRLILAGDYDEIVKQSAQTVDIGKNSILPIRSDYGESVIYGAALLADRVVHGSRFKFNVTEKLGIPVSLEYPYSYGKRRTLVFGRNVDFGTTKVIELPIHPSDKSLPVELMAQNLGLQLGTYKIHIQHPMRNFLTPGWTYSIQVEVIVDHNGTLSFEAQLIEKIGQNRDAYPLRAERIDLLNLNKNSIEEYKRFIIQSVQTSEERDTIQAKAELGDYLSHLRQQVQDLINNNSSADRIKLLKSEIDKTSAMIQDPSCDLETLRSQLLTLRKLVSD